MSREENVYMAKLAEQAERYEEMVEFMEKVAKTSDTDELTVEERNLLSVAYKNVIGARRASWRIISSIEQKEESRGNEDHVNIIKDYRGKIETELSKICDGILNLLETHLVPAASSAESKVFYLKMKGDYHRYLAEFKTGAERKEAAESTLLAYKSAQVNHHFIYMNAECLFHSNNLKFIFWGSFSCRILRWLTWHQLILSDWDLHSTSLFSIMKSLTHQTVLAILQSRYSENSFKFLPVCLMWSCEVSTY